MLSSLTDAQTLTQTIWAGLESIVIIGTPAIILVRNLRKLDKRLDKIDYALFNDGKTGLVNKVDSIIEKQQSISEDVAVLKAEIKPVRKPRG